MIKRLLQAPEADQFKPPQVPGLFTQAVLEEKRRHRTETRRSNEDIHIESASRRDARLF